MDLSPSKVAPSSILSIAADRYNCYVGEPVTLFLRFIVPQQPGTFLQLRLPHVMKVESYQMPEGVSVSVLSLNQADQEFILQIQLEAPFEPGKICEMKVLVRVNTFQMDQYLLTEAQIFDSNSQLLAYESMQIAVISQGKYMQYLPEIYESDQFINRFLMLLESFWKPINQQVDQIDCHFDPLLTPTNFLPWLSSWIGLPVDSSLPSDRLRLLLKSAMMFHQQRGTYQALKTYLEIFSGGEVSIQERRARNFILNANSKLGVEIALGKDNQPNSLRIDIQVPLDELNKTKLTKEMYQRKMKEIARSLVPAHTVFEVNCEFTDNNYVELAKGMQP